MALTGSVTVCHTTWPPGADTYDQYVNKISTQQPCHVTHRDSALPARTILERLLPVRDDTIHYARETDTVQYSLFTDTPKAQLF